MLTTTTINNGSLESLASWQRARSDEELFSLITRRTELLGEINDDDFELAAV